MPINIIVTFGRQRVDLFSGYRVDIDAWDSKRKTVKPNVINESGQSAVEINNKLDEFAIRLKQYLREAVADGKRIEKDNVKFFFRTLREKHNPNNLHNAHPVNTVEKEKSLFFDVYTEYLSHCKTVESLTNSSISKKRSFKNTLMDFDNKLSFDKMDKEGLTNLLNYFVYKREWKNSTIKRQLKAIKTFLRYAYDKGYLKNDDFLSFKPNIKTIEKKVVFLTIDEIKQIIELKIPIEQKHIEEVRDVLVFTCFTGLRFSDVQQLRKTNIIDNKIHIVTQKTSDPLIIELNDTAKKILDKYESSNFKNDKVLPVKTNQETNRYLKDLGEIAELNQPVIQYYYQGRERMISEKPKKEYLTTHIGRRSFICLCISRGIPIPVIMKWTGHKDYDSMRPYIDVTSTTRESEMKKLNFKNY